MNDANRQAQVKARGKAEWTIMVYIAADDILANFAIESLKQLKEAAGDGIVVVAQLDVDGPFARQRIRRYIFDDKGSQDTTIDRYIVKTLDSGTNMVDPVTLTSFIDEVYNEERYKAQHYCLVLWGHGPELLAETVPSNGAIPKNSTIQPNTRLYLTPRELGTALKDAHLGDSRKKLDIFALDTCSSSIAEVGIELSPYVDFMVASQEDVPDQSFPYLRLLQLFRDKKDDVEGICKTGVAKYLATYQDYIFGANTNTSKVTLASLQLENLETLKRAVKDLAAALLAATASSSPLILEARKRSQDFVAGLFVDLFDFCEKMLGQLAPGKNDSLEKACRKVLDSFKPKGESGFILANAALEPTKCHGLSIYFPFLTEEDKQEMMRTLVKGGAFPTKGGDILNMRRQRIAEIEAYQPDLEISKQTYWYDFIKDGWSRLLAQQLQPDELDVHYSAQQCALNLLSSAKKLTR